MRSEDSLKLSCGCGPRDDFSELRYPPKEEVRLLMTLPAISLISVLSSGFSFFLFPLDTFL